MPGLQDRRGAGEGGAGLRCAQCKRVYPVRDDIPIMLPEEATVEG